MSIAGPDLRVPANNQIHVYLSDGNHGDMLGLCHLLLFVNVPTARYSTVYNRYDNSIFLDFIIFHLD